MRRAILVTTASLLVVGGATAALVGAQAPPPTVTAVLSARSVTLQGAEALAAGPTRLEFRNPSRRAPAEASLAALRPGVTVEQVRAALRTARSPAPFKRLVTFEAGGSVPPNGTYATTIDLRPGTTYVALHILQQAGRSPLATFTVGAEASGAARPAPAATVGVYDYSFGMPSTLPRRGVIRFENRGERLHIAVAIRLRPGASRTAAVRALLNNQERRAERLVVERDVFEPQGVVSGGAVNDVEVSFRRPGNWLFVCFIPDGERGNPPHNTLGMVKAFSVR